MERSISEKIGFYAIWIGIVSVFISAWIPFFNYVSIAGISVSYITNLWREYELHKKVAPMSVILCFLTIGWLVSRMFVESQYAFLLGQCLTYVYLFHSSYQLLGKVNKRLVMIAIPSITIGILRAMFKSPVISFINLAFTIGVLFVFIDPILEKIALDHRAKRLAAEAEKEKVDEQPGNQPA